MSIGDVKKNSDNLKHIRHFRSLEDFRNCFSMSTYCSIEYCFNDTKVINKTQMGRLIKALWEQCSCG